MNSIPLGRVLSRIIISFCYLLFFFIHADVLLAATLLGLSPHTAQTTYLYGKKLIGGTISTVKPVNSVKKCESLCKRNRQCTAWTWVNPNSKPRANSGSALAGTAVLQANPRAAGPNAVGTAGGDDVWLLPVDAYCELKKGHPRERYDANSVSGYVQIELDAQCTRYSQTAVEQQWSNIKRQCGFIGYQWNKNKNYHYKRCLESSNRKLILREYDARKSMLDHQCIQTGFVPSVFRSRQTEARAILEKSGFKLGQVAWTDSSLPQDIVAKQYPVAQSKRALGTRVDIWLADAKRVQVPDLVGKKQIVAGTMLYDKGLKLGTIGRKDSEKASGIVLTQDPAANSSVVEGRSVTIVVSEHVIAQVQVPNLFGLKQAAAQAILNKKKLKLGQIFTPRSVKPDGVVFRQNPHANESVNIGAAVAISVSRQVVKVPMLVGQPHSKVKSILHSSHLKMGSVTPKKSKQVDGIVLTQKPDPGDAVRVGSVVHIVVSKQQVQVPDVIKMSEAKAIEMLSHAGLTIGSITKKPSVNADDEVLQQSLKANDLVDLNASIDLVIAQLSLVTVPDLSALDIEGARVLLHEYGLLLGSSRSEISQQKAGTILNQNPIAGNQVRVGAVVSVSIAKPEVVIDRTWWFVSAAVLLVLGVSVYSFRARSRAARLASAAAAASLQVKAHHDSGSSQAVFEGAKATGHDIQFKPVADKGEQHLSIDPDATSPATSNKETGDER